MTARAAIAAAGGLTLLATFLAAVASAAAPSTRALATGANASAPSTRALAAGARTGPASTRPVDARGAAAAPSVRLTIDFARRAGGRRHVAHLRCTARRASADGFLRAVGAARACAHARRIAGLLARPRDRHRACSQIYGGPERALVAGSLGGRRIRRGFTRTNGCGIADWRRAMPLLPRPR